MIKRRGTSIIEIIIATALISVSIIAALSLANSSQKQNTYARGLAEATKYSTQAADWVRTQRNELGYATIASLDDGEYCLNSFPTDFTLLINEPCTDGSYILDTLFQRRLILLKTTSTTRATIIVSWIENKPPTRQSKIEMELTQW
jgi:type II secretory pathway pseudopilin PulG